MSKSLVEKYQQILEQDPGSLVFVELAKALLDRGDHGEASRVCEHGIELHPDSVVGRVLLGKALIGCGRPAEAMEQFDKAIEVERDNPYAYNLIGEVLLHKGLYRSALPILKKAVALQPSDSRVRQWLDQAQRAVSGVPAIPEDRDMTLVDPPGKGTAERDSTSPDAVPPVAPETVPGLSDVFRSLASRDPSKADSRPPASTKPAPPASAPAEVATSPAAPAIDLPPPPVLELPREALPFETIPEPKPANGGGSSEVPTRAEGPTQPIPDDLLALAGVVISDRTEQMEIPGEAAPPAPSEPETAPASGEVIPGLTGVFESLATRSSSTPSQGQAAAPPSAPPPPPPSASRPPPPPSQASGRNIPASSPRPFASLLPELDAPPEGEPARTSPESPAAREEPSVQVSPDLLSPPERPKPEAKLPTVRRPPPPPPIRSKLLPDLPSMPPPHHTVSDEIPSVMLAPEAAEDIAKEYERELRAKLLATPPPNFWKRNWLTLSACVGLVLVSGLGVVIYRATRIQHKDSDLITLRSKSFQSLFLDTPQGLRDSITLARRVLEISPDDKDAKTAIAFASASLYQAYDRSTELKATAEAGLPVATEAHPALALAIPYLVAGDPKSTETSRAALLAATADSLPRSVEGAQVLWLAGRVLLGTGKTEDALARFDAAVKIDGGHVATLATLGDYYLSQNDAEQALQWFGRGKQASPNHVRVLLGMVNTRLALNDATDLDADLAAAREAYGDPKKTGWPEWLSPELDLAEARVMAAKGQQPEAVARLTAGAERYPDRAADFFAAIGTIEALSGNYDKAEVALGKAVEKRSTDLALREELARALIARGRPAEALKRTAGAQGDDRRLKVVRGIAFIEAGQPMKAREELKATERAGKVPAEAAVWLAMTDLALGNRDNALPVLEAAARSTKVRSAAQVGLGRIHEGDGAESKAIADYMAAMTDRRDWEGACSLGRLHLKAGRFADAKKALTSAVERNRFHAESRVALGQALLGLGEIPKAKEELLAAVAIAPSAAASRALARVALATGDLADARRQVGLAWRLEPKNPDNARLGAMVALAAGDSQEALRSLEKAAKANPSDLEAACAWGETLVKVGEAAAAKKVFDGALKVDKTNVRARLGMVAASLPDGARGIQREADALVKETASGGGAASAKAMALAARVKLASSGKKPSGAAIASADKLAKGAVKADDTSADAHYAMALVALAQKDEASAVKELSRVVAADPVMAEAHLALGVALVRTPSERQRALSEAEAYLRIAPKGPDAGTAKKLSAMVKKALEESE